MWKYEQSSGAMIRPDGSILKVGYSGKPPNGVNDPEMQCVKNVGPIPRGFYTIEAPKSKKTKPYYMPLTPYPETDTCGRDGFQLHGDNLTHTASIGCIVLSPRAIREEIWESGDHVLRVVRDSSDVTTVKLRHAVKTVYRGR